MKFESLYSDEIWEKFCDKIAGSSDNFELKTYPHFDPIFNFLTEKDKIRKLVSDKSLAKVSQHSFLPFLKIVTSTPRYKWQEKSQAYALEVKNRPIAFASHFDTYVFAFYSFVLTELYQNYIRKAGFDDCVLAYRTDLEGKCNIQFAKEVFNVVEDCLEESGECDVIALDITGYFDNISHSILKEKWCKLLDTASLPRDQYKIFKALTSYTYVNYHSLLRHFKIDLTKVKKAGKNSKNLCSLIDDSIAGSTFKEKFELIRKRRLMVSNTATKKGIPQGSSMSALLSNVYLMDFDEFIYNKSKEFDFAYKRYCDDLIVVCKPSETDNIQKILFEEIAKYSLVIQKKKTELIAFRKSHTGKYRGFNKLTLPKRSITKQEEIKHFKNLQYLGFEFNGTNIYLRHSSLSRFFRKMKGRIIKTVMMSYSSNSNDDEIRRAQIFNKYSHFGERNFYSYAQKAASSSYLNSHGKMQLGMNSKSIKRQLSSHISIIEKEIKSKSKQRYLQKEEARKERKNKGKKAKTVKLKL